MKRSVLVPGRIMKQTAFLREKNGDYAACLKYSVWIFVE
jgi:hypothetical protein